MSRAQFWLAMIGLYSAFALFVGLAAFVIASVTVIPMYQNYRHHGSIFLETHHEGR